MSNLRDIEILETLSLGELDRVVGGRDRGGRKARCRFRRFVFSGAVVTQIDAEGIELDSTSNGQGRGGRSATYRISVQ